MLAAGAEIWYDEGMNTNIHIFAWLGNDVRHRRITIGLIVLSLLFSAGCIILPVPHYRRHMCGIDGTVCDAETGRPLANADISVNAGRYNQHTITDEFGHFSTRETHGWHFIFWIATPSSGSLLPTHIDYSDGLLHDLTVVAAGYERTIFYAPIGFLEEGVVTNCVFYIDRKGKWNEDSCFTYYPDSFWIKVGRRRPNAGPFK